MIESWTDCKIDKATSYLQRLVVYFTNRRHRPDVSREALKIRSCEYT